MTDRPATAIPPEAADSVRATSARNAAAAEARHAPDADADAAPADTRSVAEKLGRPVTFTDPRRSFGNEYRAITVDDVPAYEDAVQSIVEGWYLDAPLDVDAFLDRITEHEMLDLAGDYDDPVVKALLKMARRVRRECLA